MLQEQINNEGNQISVIIFEVGLEQFAINLLDVKEIIQAGQIRRLPKSLDFVDGIYNYRGDIIHVINLKKKLALESYRVYNSEDILPDDNNNLINKFIIIINVNGINIGFIVDKIINVAHIKPEDLVGLSPIFQTSIGIEYIKGIIKFEDRPRILINLNKVISESEQSSIQKELTSLIQK